MSDDVTELEITKTQKSRYLENETVFSKKKSLITSHQGLPYGKN